jgi:hypothetical protein
MLKDEQMKYQDPCRGFIGYNRRFERIAPICWNCPDYRTIAWEKSVKADKRLQKLVCMQCFVLKILCKCNDTKEKG